MHRNAVELAAAVEEVELDDEGEADEGRAEAADEGRRGGRPAGGQDVVDNQHLVVGAEGVVVDLEGIAAVLEDVFVAPFGPRQLARLADGNESGAEGAGHAAPEDEA